MTPDPRVAFQTKTHPEAMSAVISPPFQRYAAIIPDPEGFEASLRRPLDRFVWTNPLKTIPDRLRPLLAEAGFGPVPLPWDPSAFRITGGSEGLGSHWGYFAGFYQIQEASSMVPVQLLDARPGMRILDLCAAPGNKTAQAAAFMNNRGTLIANDAIGGRLSAVRFTTARLGILNVSVTCHDGVNFPKRAGSFDRVIVDAPCSCEGISRKNPRVLKRSRLDRKGFARRQLLLLEQGIRRCRPGGRILYSTCTYAPEENEAVVDAALRRRSGEIRVLPASLDGLRTSPGLIRWDGVSFHTDLAHTLRIWPHLNDTGGFYLALLERLGSPEDVGNQSGASIATTQDTSHRRLEPNRRDAYTRLLNDRFGIPSSTFEDLQWLEKGTRHVFVAASDHDPKEMPCEMNGFPLLHVRPATPRLTSEAATLFGGLATRNRVDLTAEQLTRYMQRRDVDLEATQIESVTGSGIVLVGAFGTVIGNGYCRVADRRLVSYFPKKWM